MGDDATFHLNQVIAKSPEIQGLHHTAVLIRSGMIVWYLAIGSIKQPWWGGTVITQSAAPRLTHTLFLSTNTAPLKASRSVGRLPGHRPLTWGHFQKCKSEKVTEYSPLAEHTNRDWKKKKETEGVEAASERTLTSLYSYSGQMSVVPFCQHNPVENKQETTHIITVAFVRDRKLQEEIRFLRHWKSRLKYSMCVLLGAEIET